MTDPDQIIEAIREAVIELDGLVVGYIFGSFAARYHGVDGPPPSDIDVLLIGTVERRAASTMCTDLSRRLGHEVNGYRITVAAWEAESPDALVRDVRTHPLILLLTDFEMAYRDSDARKVVEESRASDVLSTWRPGPPGAAT
ncbi:hypothetical protein [Tsukamurella paurometabola]|uniref:Nucleotidyltransferase domain-containing protein n=1 Tax=Tsukamurella paurometabola TaxID=2061 RepID=A0A3P8MEL1_TSUPA|nr:hypothetical protein [Tsukamurella paurometabola]UEA83290.1 hypothetical protein LK411_00050 [Tsukamurella paurometabola]VDR40393.1 Uncharacterised protein [Tsukamurella paurometabola]